MLGYTRFYKCSSSLRIGAPASGQVETRLWWCWTIGFTLMYDPGLHPRCPHRNRGRRGGPHACALCPVCICIRFRSSLSGPDCQERAARIICGGYGVKQWKEVSGKITVKMSFFFHAQFRMPTGDDNFTLGRDCLVNGPSQIQIPYTVLCAYRVLRMGYMLE